MEMKITDKYHIFDDNKVKFNVHTNFCGRKECVHFNKCGQALSDTAKHRFINKGLIPQIDTHGSIACYSETEPEKPEGKLEVDNTPDWPAQ